MSPNSGSTAGGTAVTITGTNFAAGATVTFGGTAATNVVVVNSTTDHGDDAGGHCRCGDGDGDQSGRAEWEPGQCIYLRCAADGEQRSAEQRIAGGRYGGDDHGDELRGGSDGDVWRDSGDERGGGEQHDDHGDDAGGKRGRGDRDGDQQQRTEWKLGQRIYLHWTTNSE